MKKLLAICSIFFTVCTAFASCGSNDVAVDENGSSVVVEDRTDSNGSRTDRTTDNHDNNSVGDYAEDAVDGVGDAGKDIINGAGNAGKEAIDGVENAADDLIDGVDGKREKSNR